MKFSLRARLIVLGVPPLLCLLLLEGAVRRLSPADQDGNRRFRDTLARVDGACAVMQPTQPRRGVRYIGWVVLCHPPD